MFEKCPVCGGRGLVPNGFYNAVGAQYYYNTTSTAPEVCRSCGGKGYLVAYAPMPQPIVPMPQPIAPLPDDYGLGTLPHSGLAENEEMSTATDPVTTTAVPTAEKAEQ